MKRILGMVNFHAKFLPNISAKTEPLRKLLDEKYEWYWGKEQENAWEVLKKTLTSKPVLKYYDADKDILVSSDASKNGLGACILQKHGNQWCPVAYASRAMTKAEQNYTQIQKETLAMCFACERFHQYVFGRKFEVETNHKPLVSKALCVFH